jgi:hypothetical protein
MEQEQSITVQPTQLPALAPLSPEDAKAMMKMYQEYVSALIGQDDLMLIQNKQFKKKSAWRKLAMANSLSVRVVDERREELPHGDYAYHFVCEATHPNGRVTSGSGSCTAYEKAQLKDNKWVKYDSYSKTWKEAQPNSLHNVRSTAETRAWNRAVSNMIAAGEVSAEEVDQGQHHNVIEVNPTKTTAHESEWHCSQCGIPVSQKVMEFSHGKFNKILCFECQKKQ